MSKHTPGPWHVFRVYAQHEVRTPTDTLVAVVSDRANARLIAAAPELLEALLECVCAIERTLHCTEADRLAAADKARAAIAKATGAV